MKIGIVGLAMAGKKTLFQILSENGKNLVKRGNVELALTTVLDNRLKKLSDMYNPKKTTYAHLEFILTPSITKENKGSTKALNAIHSVDGIVIVVKDYAMTSDDKSTPQEDFEFVYNEIIFNDLFNVESRLEKIEKMIRKINDPLQKKHKIILEKVKTHLEENKALRDMDMNEEEATIIQSFDFLSMKPYLVLVNIDESAIGQKGKYDFLGNGFETLSLKIEDEMSLLESEEQQEFLGSLGLKESGLNKLIADSYKITNLISFFTAGEDEVKAWTIKKNTNARKAAGEIHSDIEKGFIRAEVISYDDFIKAGSEKEAKNQKLYRLEGKDYLVQDGDIINFRFNV